MFLTKLIIILILQFIYINCERVKVKIYDHRAEHDSKEKYGKGPWNYYGYGYGLEYQYEPDGSYERQKGYGYVKAYGRDFCKETDKSKCKNNQQSKYQPYVSELENNNLNVESDNKNEVKPYFFNNEDNNKKNQSYDLPVKRNFVNKYLSNSYLSSSASFNQPKKFFIENDKFLNKKSQSFNKDIKEGQNYHSEASEHYDGFAEPSLIKPKTVHSPEKLLKDYSKSIPNSDHSSFNFDEDKIENEHDTPYSFEEATHLRTIIAPQNSTLSQETLSNFTSSTNDRRIKRAIDWLRLRIFAIN